MADFAERLMDVVRDSTLMVTWHARRIVGVGATAVRGLVDEVNGLAQDCGDVVKTGLLPRPEQFDLRLGVGSIDLDPSPRRERVCDQEG